MYNLLAFLILLALIAAAITMLDSHFAQTVGHLVSNFYQYTITH